VEDCIRSFILNTGEKSFITRTIIVHYVRFDSLLISNATYYILVVLLTINNQNNYSFISASPSSSLTSSSFSLCTLAKTHCKNASIGFPAAMASIPSSGFN
jgi:hypothetical protein